ncbi:membrane protein DedA with SNARE-associated domain [Bacillus oleivorans]|uniref:Membrane protein DedA with SNARE-associated domain n=1 Tax=Bacillus oleivorans TaxID=1448271 RepID=A0A285D600_9BACI|nr:DedA family protein [Bacillus oleivorans]SNX75241.1 membrane protein DedA with SNARE-associated domain [Bacillus oleivorans]
MDLESLQSILDQFNYFGLFLWLWLGVFGAPIPNEIIVMTIGFASSTDLLISPYAFIAVYLGIVGALTTCYLLGRLLGKPLLKWIKQKKRLNQSLEKAIRFMNKHHTFSLPLSYFLPGFRNFVPFLYGISKLSYKKFALLSYSAALVWVTGVFFLGYWFGEEIDTIQLVIEEIIIVAGAILILLTVFLVWKRKKREVKAPSK